LSYIKNAWILRFVIVLTAASVFAETPQEAFIYMSPVPASELVLSETTILLRTGQLFDNSDSIALAGVTITGNQSGVHDLQVICSDDYYTAILKPGMYFTSGEVVTVDFESLLINGTVVDGDFTFTITVPISNLDRSDYREFAKDEIYGEPDRLPDLKNDEGLILDDDPSLPYDFPDRVLLLDDNPDSGYVFVSNMGRDAGVSYLLILDNDANPIYYHRLPYWTWDFKKQPNGFLSYIVEDTPYFIVMDSTYTVVDSFRTQNGYYTDEHDFQMLDNGHVLIAAYDYETVDMSQIVPGGRPDATVIGYVIQELDSNKNVVFQWRSWDHVEITEATNMGFTGSVIDYVHGNTLEPDNDGNLLTSFRNMESLTKINRQTGDIIWRLGGVANQFTIYNDPIGWSRQHDIRRLANGNITIYDNARLFPSPYNSSNASEYELDEDSLICTLTWEYHHDPSIYGPFMGNNQRLPNGNTIIGWGGRAPITTTEVRPDSSKAWEMTFVTFAGQRSFSYRSFRFPWHGVAARPYLILEPSDSSVHLIVNKFGDQSVVKYYIYAGPSQETYALIDSTSINYIDITDIPNGYIYFRATAVDSLGNESPYSNEERIFNYVTQKFFPGDANMINGEWPPNVIGSDVTYLVGYFRGFNEACLLGYPGFFCAERRR
jgi:hypothetical protein